jgi:hypothetical protein
MKGTNGSLKRATEIKIYSVSARENVTDKRMILKRSIEVMQAQ